MFGYIPAAEQIVRERAKSAALEEANGKLSADLDYIAMMCDIDLDTEEIEDVLNPGDHFETDNGKEYVFEGVSENGDILAEEYNSGEGENNE